MFGSGSLMIRVRFCSGSFFLSTLKIRFVFSSTFEFCKRSGSVQILIGIWKHVSEVVICYGGTVIVSRPTS